MNDTTEAQGTANDVHDEEYRRQLTRAVMGMLYDWGLTLEHVRMLLGLEEFVPLRKMSRFRSEPFPDEPSVNERIEHVICIAEALRTAYPRNPQMVRHWLQQPNRKFGKRAPLECMILDGLPGILGVRAEVDCTYAWQENSAYYTEQQAKARSSSS